MVEAVIAFVLEEAYLEDKGTYITSIIHATKTVSHTAMMDMRHALMIP